MNKRQKVLFCAGFPRSGSSLLMNILSQNNQIIGSPTSGVIGSVLSIRDNWKGNDVYKSNGDEYTYPKIRLMMKNMITGFYENEIQNNQLPIDKNRGWVHHIDLLDELFDCEVKIIFPIRHIGDCVISMEKVNRKSTVTSHGDNGNFLNERTTEGRAENFIKPDGVLGSNIVGLREMKYRGLLNRLVFVPFDDMICFPNETFKRIYDELELEYFQHDFENVKQVIFEQDLMHGFAPNSLHKIKEGKVDYKMSERDNTVFRNEYINNLEQNVFGDVTTLINDVSMVKRYLNN